MQTRDKCICLIDDYYKEVNFKSILEKIVRGDSFYFVIISSIRISTDQI